MCYMCVHNLYLFSLHPPLFASRSCSFQNTEARIYHKKTELPDVARWKLPAVDIRWIRLDDGGIAISGCISLDIHISLNKRLFFLDYMG